MYLLDCTLRDGGYYNNWDFSKSLINQYLESMKSAGVDIVELGLRSLINNKFKGACAYTTDSFINSLNIPDELKVCVMINGSELVGEIPLEEALEALFPLNQEQSPVDVVRIACHVHEFTASLPAAKWLKEKGYMVGFNLMQIAERSEDEVKSLARAASEYPIDALYFADSMGSMSPEHTSTIINWLKSEWDGALGIHTHDNLGLALSNTKQAIADGATWLDATVTGMGRGPGNARTEELAIELSEIRDKPVNMVPIMSLIKEHFKPMQNHYGWGTNPYYYLAGKYGIHPTYIQEMLNDTRYNEEDILSAINHLKNEGGKKFSSAVLNGTRALYSEASKGSWSPVSKFEGRSVLILGAGDGVKAHKEALEDFIEKSNPIVLALNTQEHVKPSLINYRVACHPVRLAADCDIHATLPQPLISPFSSLPDEVKLSLENKDVLDFGLHVKPDEMKFATDHCVTPNSLVIAYALAIATSGKANHIYLAGFDGYSGDDPRTIEMVALLELYQGQEEAVTLEAVTTTNYNIPSRSIYAL